MIIVTTMIFAAVFLTVLAICFSIQEARQSPEAELKRKLRRMASSGPNPSKLLSGDLLRKTELSGQFIYRQQLMGKITRMIAHSGIQINPLRFVLLTVITAITSGFVLFAVRGNALASLVALLTGAVVPLAYIYYRKEQRQIQFDEQLPDALTMISRSLRAGHSLSGAIELISQEMPEPTKGIFKTAYDQQQLGMRISDSLKTLLAKIDSIDLHFFVTIIRINSETGGNLAEILDKLADTIRSRQQVRRQVKVFSAQGRLSGYILTVLPLVVFIAFNILNPGYMKVFYTEKTCQYALFAALLAQLAGFVMIRKIVNIRI